MYACILSSGSHAVLGMGSNQHKLKRAADLALVIGSALVSHSWGSVSAPTRALRAQLMGPCMTDLIIGCIWHYIDNPTN